MKMNPKINIVSADFKEYLKPYNMRNNKRKDNVYSSFIRKFILPYTLKRENRHTSLYHWRAFESSQHWPRQKLLDFQWLKLKEILTHAYNYSPYYSRIFKERNLTPDSFKSFDDLKLIPIITKDIISNNIKDMLCTNYDKKNQIMFTTGGTTRGRLTKLYRDNESHMIKQGMSWLHENWVGRKPAEKMALFWSATVDYGNKESFKEKIKSRFILRQAFYGTGSSKEDLFGNYYKDLCKLRPNILKVFPSALEIFCLYLQKHNLKPPSTHGIMSTGEILYPHQRKLFENLFDCKVFDLYGCREAGHLACECEAHENLHLTMETQYTEFIDNDNSVESGQEGDIVLTDLTNYAMPLIRYKVGDRGIPIDGYCSCGRESALMKSASGRISDYFWGPDGTRHAGLVIANQIITESMEIGEMQIIQKSIYDFCVRLTNQPPPSDETMNIIKNGMKKIIDLDINVSFEIVDKIPLEASGKKRFVICEIDRPISS